MAFVWAKDLARIPKLPKKARNMIEKISMASVFVLDSSYDSLQLSARTMAVNVVARRSLWLRQWDGDAASMTRVISIPFKDGKLFSKH